MKLATDLTKFAASSPNLTKRILVHPINENAVRTLQPILTESIETDPPSMPSTGKLISSPSHCKAST